MTKMFLSKLRTLGALSALAFCATVLTPAASAQATTEPAPTKPTKPYPEPEIKTGITAVAKDINGNDIYQATTDYYENFNFTWKDSKGNEHTNSILDRAEEKEHIIALLTEIYTNPQIPGYRADASYNLTVDGKYIYHDMEAPIFPVQQQKTDPSGNDLGGTKRSEFWEINYEPCPHYPYNMDKAGITKVEAPINGCTALLVEASDIYWDLTGGKNNILCGDPTKYDADQEAIVDKAFEYIKAVTLIPSQIYVPASQSTNPGFLFNIDATLSKCFIITKGCNRAWKTYTFSYDENGKSSVYQLGNNTGKMVNGIPFFNMFEEFSPSANGGATLDAFAQMDGGVAFSVEHSCSSTMQQEHIIVMDPSRYDQNQYEVNLMFYVPDYRFEHDCAVNPETEKYATQYAFYAKHRRPYLFFNRIHAEIRSIYMEDIVNEGENQYVDIPLKWTSQYKEIVKQNSTEQFLIYHVVDGEVDFENDKPIPLENITIKEEGTTTEDGKPYIYRSVDGVVNVLVREKYDPSLAGKEITYVILGQRAHDEDVEMEYVESNFVTATLPGNNMTLNLNLAISKATVNSTTQQNQYTNYVNIIYKDYDYNNPYEQQQGNLKFGDLFDITDLEKVDNPTKDGFASTWTPKLRNNRELRIYRDETPIGKFAFERYDNSNGTKSTADAIIKGNVQGAERAQLVIYMVAKDLKGNNLMTLKEGHPCMFHAKAYFPWGETMSANSAFCPLDGFQGWHKVKSVNSSGAIVETIESNLVDISSDDTPNLKNTTGLLGSFSDTFTVNLSELDRPYDYQYTIRLIETDEDGVEHEVGRSNQADIDVPVRTLHAGFVPYTEAQIIADTKIDDEDAPRLEPNAIGLGIKVGDNSRVSNYRIFDLDNPTETIVQITRSTENASFSYTDAKGKHTTLPHFTGTIQVALPEKYTAGDNTKFGTIITYLNSAGEYANNTYGLVPASIPERPVLSFKDKPAINIADMTVGKEQHLYPFKAEMEVKNAEGWSVHGFGLWSREYVYSWGNFDKHQLVHHGPSDFTTDNTTSKQSVRKVVAPTEDGTYPISYQAPAITDVTTADPGVVMFEKNARLYAVIPDQYNAGNTAVPGYLVTDASTFAGYDANGGISGIDDVNVETPVYEEEYFNLQGVKIPAENLAPGIYIRRAGNEVSKILVK